jgi:hypothetical protein
MSWWNQFSNGAGATRGDSTATMVRFEAADAPASPAGYADPVASKYLERIKSAATGDEIVAAYNDFAKEFDARYGKSMRAKPPADCAEVPSQDAREWQRRQDAQIAEMRTAQRRLDADNAAKQARIPEATRSMGDRLAAMGRKPLT